MDRRQMLKRMAATGVTLAYAAPAVQVLSMTSASAQDASGGGGSGGGGAGTSHNNGTLATTSRRLPEPLDEMTHKAAHEIDEVTDPLLDEVIPPTGPTLR